MDKEPHQQHHARFRTHDTPLARTAHRDFVLIKKNQNKPKDSDGGRGSERWSTEPVRLKTKQNKKTRVGLVVVVVGGRRDLTAQCLANVHAQHTNTNPPSRRVSTPGHRHTPVAKHLCLVPKTPKEEGGVRAWRWGGLFPAGQFVCDRTVKKSSVKETLLIHKFKYVLIKKQRRKIK